MKNSGYYRFPTINGDKVAFISENDLWIISLKDSSPKRLTANMGYVRHPYFSPDGKFIAFVASFIFCLCLSKLTVVLFSNSS